MEPTARLIIHIGTEPERELILGEGDILLGRDASNDIVTTDTEASRRHSRIALETDGYLVEDLGSTNGTFVNGQRVTMPTPIHDGDTITLGRAVRILFMGHAPTLGIDPLPPEAQKADDTAAVFAPPAPVMEAYAPPEPAPAAIINEPEPPSAVAPQPAVKPPVQVAKETGCQRYFLYTGCGVLSLLLIAGVVVFALDSVAPEVLYCGSLESFWNTILDPVLQLFNRTFDCSVLVDPA